MIKKQQGFFALLAVLLIVVIGFLGLAIAYIVNSSAGSTLNFHQSGVAFYIAEGGLEKAARYLLTPNLTGSAARITCSGINANSNLTNSSLGAGTFTVTTISGSPFYANTTLSSAITSSSTSIPVVSTTGFASSGRILIDNEAINYSAISGNNFIGAIRGMNKTVASAHASGATVAQYQCSLEAEGGIPNLTSPLYKRELQESVQLQQAWAVGARNGNSLVLTQWNYPTQLQWTNASYLDSINRENLNSITLLTNANGWAVGNERNNNFTIVRLLGATLTSTSKSGACAGQNLTSISAVSSQEAFAVGISYRTTTCTSGNYRHTFLYWNGATWNLLSSATTPSIPADNSAKASVADLEGVHVISTTSSGVGNFGFAVGLTGFILQYNGSQWVKISSPTTRDLYSVFVVSSNEAWAVGQSGEIIKWNGSSWSVVSSPTTTQLNSIYMVDTNGDGLADAGWAVGQSGVAITYNGSTWSAQSPGGSNLFAVAAFNGNDAWAAGVNGRMIHWDGSAWNTVTSGVTTNLNGIAIITPKRSPSATWEEIFP